MAIQLHNEEEWRLLADTAALAGKIMLVSGGETYRVEDTIRRILSTSGFEYCEAFVVTTGIIITLEDKQTGTITLTRRVGEKQTNLGNIANVNKISRQYCQGKLSLAETYHILKRLEPVSYPDWITFLSMCLTASSFTFILGGGFPECATAAWNGLYFIISKLINRKLQVNGFVFNMVASFFMAFTSIGVQILLLPNLLLEPLIAGSIMALLPGLALTNGIRDTLAGDYMSGGARIVEAFVIAASLAIGIGAGLFLGGTISGGV